MLAELHVTVNGRIRVAEVFCIRGVTIGSVRHVRSGFLQLRFGFQNELRVRFSFMKSRGSDWNYPTNEVKYVTNTDKARAQNIVKMLDNDLQSI